MKTLIVLALLLSVCGNAIKGSETNKFDFYEIKKNNVVAEDSFCLSDPDFVLFDNFEIEARAAIADLKLSNKENKVWKRLSWRLKAKGAFGIATAAQAIFGTVLRTSNDPDLRKAGTVLLISSGVTASITFAI